MSVPDEDRTTSSFLRGLTLGAILGAIIAGSSAVVALVAREARPPLISARRRPRSWTPFRWFHACATISERG